MLMKVISVFAGLIVLTTAVLAAPLSMVPPTPAAVDGVVYVRPFTLTNGFEYTWSQERPTVKSGTLLVLKVSDSALIVPRQIAEPVLYVGDYPAQRLNSGWESGYVVALVPGDVDLAKTPIWFGTPALPESVNQAQARTERAQAEAAGIKPFAEKELREARERGGSRMNVADMCTLLHEEVASLIERYSPQEKALVETYRVPAGASQPVQIWPPVPSEQD
jgi:hypothetical protein